MDYYYTDFNNKSCGPISLEQLQALAATSSLNATTMIAEVGSQQWSPIGTIIPLGNLQQARRNEPLAIWSFVLGLIGLFICPLVTSIPAVICGHMAISRMKQNPQLEGKGFALAGLITGYIASVFWLLYLAVVVIVALAGGR